MDMLNRQTFRCAIVLMGLAAALGCGGDSAFAPSSDVHVLLKSVQLAEHAYNLSVVSPYDTVRVHAVAAMADGSPASGTIRYSTSDSTLTVDSSGFIHAYAVTGTRYGSYVYASITENGITRRDSALVRVFSVPYLPANITCVIPAFGNLRECRDTTYDLSGFRSGIIGARRSIVNFTVRDSVNSFVDSLVVAVTSSDTAVINLFDGIVASNVNGICCEAYEKAILIRDTGQAWIRFSTNAFGRNLRDSVRVRVGLPTRYKIRSGCNPCIDVGTVHKVWHFYPAVDTVPAGSDVIWLSPAALDDTIGPSWDVEFTEPAYALASSIPPLAVNGVWTGTFDGFGFNEHGGSGNIAPFQIVVRGDADITQGRFVFLGAEARRFVTPGRYPFRSSAGAQGVLVVK